MRNRIAAISLAFFLVATLAACGGGAGSMGVQPQPGPGSDMVPVSFSISDTPPAGVTILRFQIQVASAALQPAAMGQQPVPMLPAPVEVELEHLQTEPALLANLNVPAGTYNGLTATFTNPQATILNEGTTNLMVGDQVCNMGQVCTLTLPLNQMTVTVQVPTAPFPITLSSNSPLGLILHFDVNASVQGDLSVSPTINLKQIPAPPGIAFERFHVVGTLTNVSSPDFTLQTGFGNLSFTIATDDNTQYDFGSSCMADNFTCLMMGQVLKVSVKLMSGGMLLATKVKLLEPPGLPAFEGIVINTNSAQNQFQVVLTDFQDGPNMINLIFFGIRITITPTASAMFMIDNDGITVPAGLSFASVQDIVVGQTVEFHPVLPPGMNMGGTPPAFLGIGADSIRLEASQITGTVSTVNAPAMPPNFILGGLPPLFGHAGITQLTVEPVTGTEFDNVSGLGGLSAGNTVSVGGLVFNTSGQPTVIAETIVLRDDGD